MVGSPDLLSAEVSAEVVDFGLSNRVDQSRDGTEVENQKPWVV
jgi:hypothetical protein